MGEWDNSYISYAPAVDSAANCPVKSAAITDYFPTWRVPKTRKIADWANVLMVFIVGWGYYEFETNDVGLTEGIKRIWKAGANAKDAEAKLAGGPLDKL